MANNRTRQVVAVLALSATGLVSLVSYEGYTNNAVIPIPGDVPTLGFGTTDGVKMGDRITPPKALARALQDISKFEGAIKLCVTVPLHQYEYDAMTQLAYNIGAGAFCRSTVVAKVNAGRYREACDAILLWNKAKGKVIAGLVNRRERERDLCLGVTG